MSSSTDFPTDFHVCRHEKRREETGRRHEPAAGCTWVLAIHADEGSALDNPAEYATSIPVLSAPASYPAGVCCPDNLATQRPREYPRFHLSRSDFILGAMRTRSIDCDGKHQMKLNTEASIKGMRRGDRNLLGGRNPHCGGIITLPQCSPG